MNNLKKWRFWIASPLILLILIYLMPVLIFSIMNFSFSLLADLSGWVENKLNKIYDSKAPKIIGKKIIELSKWTNQ